MKILFSILFLSIASCSTNKQKSENSYVGFKPPFLIQTSNFDSVENWHTDGINQVFPILVGQYQFSDTVNIGKREQRHLTKDEYIWEHNTFDFDTLSSDGLQIYPDYATTVKAKQFEGATKANVFFPVYVVNETNTPKLFIGKDDYVFAIQEAVDTSSYDRWYAIEAKGFDFCGNGYFRRKLLPREFIMILMPKYSGNKSTYIRTRIKIGENILISRPYNGVIDKRQFTISNDSWISANVNDSSYKWIFYGAQNKN
jgi:hypothetical protein